jgi:hypothetical protein
MPQTLNDRLAVLFEYTCVSNADDLLKIAREAKENKSRMPSGSLFFTSNDILSKKTIQKFLLHYGSNKK